MTNPGNKFNLKKIKIKLKTNDWGGGEKELEFGFVEGQV
jgi:hypothetical protein